VEDWISKLEDTLDFLASMGSWDKASELMIILIFPNDARLHASVSVDLVHWALVKSDGILGAICLVHFLSKEA
jgi:hypothetical protein